MGVSGRKPVDVRLREYGPESIAEGYGV